MRYLAKPIFLNSRKFDLEKFLNNINVQNMLYYVHLNIYTYKDSNENHDVNRGKAKFQHYYY